MSSFLGIASTDEWVRENVSIAWLANHNIKSKVVKPMMENITEHQVLEAFIEDFNQVYGENINDCLEQVLQNGHQYAFVLKVGNFMHDTKYTINHYFKKLWNGEKVVGHILDRKDGYYEIHPQAFMIDVKWWEEKGKPAFGDTVRCTWSITEPERSDINFHDDYTPIWVKKGTNTKQYNMKYRGADWIKLALEDDALGVWPDQIRASKEYMYPEVPDYMFKMEDIHKSMDSNILYAANTETISIKRRNKVKPHDTVICSAGGASPFLHAYTNRLRPDGNLWIYDISPLALQFQQKLYLYWDGKNYAKFLQDFMKENPLFKRHIVSTQRLREYSDFIDGINGFQEWFQKSKTTWDIRFVETDILNTQGFVRKIRGFMNPGSKVLLHTSNIFCYHKTSYLLNYNEKYILWEHLNDAIKQWKNADVDLTSNVFFNDSKRKIFEILPWYTKF